MTKKPNTDLSAEDKANAGYINSEGYRVINIDGTEYFAHDLAFLYMTGDFPKGEVEHINRKRDDDRWCNLKIKPD